MNEEMSLHPIYWQKKMNDQIRKKGTFDFKSYISKHVHIYITFYGMKQNDS